jgi:hypothetical protein
MALMGYASSDEIQALNELPEAERAGTCLKLCGNATTTGHMVASMIGSVSRLHRSPGLNIFRQKRNI